jgi:tRNA G46 methylase TrmB
MIGDYEYRSYNPETREYENGYVPLGPVDFWDKETQVPNWLDKGKYWNILLGLQTGNKEIMLQVVRDRELPFTSGRQNVAVTFKELLPGIGSSFGKLRRRYRYRVKIPQWLVINTERIRFAEEKQRMNLNDIELSSLIADLNKKVVLAAAEIIEREKPRIQYPWRITALGIYLNKSLPVRIIYRQVIRHFPGTKKHTIEDTNENLANIKDDDLVAAIIQVALQKGISEHRMENIKILVRFLKNMYTKQGIGEGSSEYHNLHHSLEVTYISLQMLPKEFHGHRFNSKDYEIILVAGLLHDYDPDQMYANTQNNATQQPKGPKVQRTIDEICKTRIHDAYFTMSEVEFENYFREYKSALLPPVEYAITHPEYVKVEWKPSESRIVEALIWRTDFPYFKQKIAQEMFEQLISHLDKNGYDSIKIKLLAEILWLADLAVTYMGSDPIRAWDRVTNLYDELYLPKFEAVSRTDAFFSDFVEIELFKELIRTITKARNLYLRINLELEMRRGEMLQNIAINNWAEYFIGIGKDQSEVLRAKSKFAELDPPNASAFWGDTHKLVPNIMDKSIDNFLMVLTLNFRPLNSMEEKLSFRSLLANMVSKLTANGTLQILTDLEKDSTKFKELIAIIVDTGFQLDVNYTGKTYFPKDWKDPDFINGKTAKILVFRSEK